MSKQNESNQIIPDRLKEEIRNEAQKRFNDSEFEQNLKLDLRHILENNFIFSFEQGYHRGYHQGYEMGEKEGYARGLVDGSAKIFPVG